MIEVKRRAIYQQHGGPTSTETEVIVHSFSDMPKEYDSGVKSVPCAVVEVIKTGEIRLLDLKVYKLTMELVSQPHLD